MINENGLLNIFPTAEASGSIVSFENGADGIPMESLSVAVEPTQDLHGYDSPWPAGGGKNLFNKDGTDENNGYVSGKYLNYLGQEATPGSGTWFISEYIPIGSEVNYALSGLGSVSTPSICFYDSSKAFISGMSYQSRASFVGTTPSGAAYARLSAGPSSTEVNTIQLELGSTATAWQPYSNICPITGRTGLSVYVGPTQDQQDATTYAVDWTSEAGTVYGGTLDVVTGVLTVDKVYKAFDGTEDWGIVNGAYFMTVVGALNSVVNDSAISTHYLDNPNISTGNYQLGFRCYNRSASPYTGAAVLVRPEAPLTISLDDFKTWLATQNTNGTPFAVCYELATPITYQLTPQEVATLLGANRVWSDAGDISLVYHTQADATPSSIDGLFINGEGLQADGWFLKWRKLAAPKPKTDYVSVWGRDGDIDLTESETDGQVFYENRELTMDMVYIGEDWTDAYSELLDMLHGKECAVQFSNDPYWYWAGRIIASLYEHKPHSLAMSGIMFPYKLSVAKVIESATVNGLTESNAVDVVLPGSRMRVSPKVTVTAGSGDSVTLKWGDNTQALSAGTYYVRGLKVGSDDVTIKVYGTGTVKFEYRKGML